MNSKRTIFVSVLLALIAGVTFGVFVASPSVFPPQQPAPAEPAKAKIGSASFGRVDLEQGCSYLSPLVPGRVAKVIAKENEKVKAGSTLVKMDDSSAKAQLDAARAAFEAAELRVSLAKDAPKRHTLRVEGQKAALEAVDSRLSAAKKVLGVRAEQFQNKLINQVDYSAAQDQVNEMVAIQQVEQNRLAELKMNDPAQETKVAVAELARAQAQVKIAEEALDQCTLRAPSDGTVIRVQVSPGEVIGGSPRQQVIVFAPDDPWIVRAEVEQEFVSAVTIGQAVEVRDEIDPNIKFTGKVSRISSWYLQRREAMRDPTRYSDSATVECIITPDAGRPPLRLGQRVSVKFLEKP